MYIGSSGGTFQIPPLYADLDEDSERRRLAWVPKRGAHRAKMMASLLVQEQEGGWAEGRAPSPLTTADDL
jgi:hypothetical protein